MLATRRRILVAAIDLFAARGYGAATMDDLARHAGVARATVYQHFGSKFGLFQALALDTAARSGLERIESNFTHPDPIVGLRALVRFTGRFWATDPPAWRQIHAFAATSDEYRAWFSRVGTDSFERLSLLVERLESGGHLQPGWTSPEAYAALRVIASFETFDQLTLRCGLDLVAIERVLARLVATVAPIQVRR